MSYKPTDTFIPSNANGYFSDDSSGAAKSYKVSITKPTRYPGEETTNGIIWLLDLDAFSKLPRNLNSNGQHPAQDLAGRDWEKDPTQAHPGTFFPTKNNYYIFASIFDFPDKNPKNGSELHDPSNDVSTRDGVKLIRLDLGSSLSRVGYGELKSTYTIDELLNLVLDYMRNIYIDIIYGRRTSTKWIEAIKEESGLSREEIKKVFDDIGNLEENKVSFFIDNDKPVDTPVPTDSQSVVQNTSDSKSSELKNIIFNVQKEGIFSNTKFGELRLIGESLVNENPGFDFGDEDDLSGLLLEDEFRESEFEGLSVEDMKLEEEKGENFGEETNYESGSVVDVKSDIAGKDKKTWEKTGTIVQGSKVPLDIAKAPSFNQKVTINKTIKTEYLDIINKIDTSYGTKLLAIVMAQKEGFEKGTRSYKTNNPGNIGNTDSGANKKLTTLKQGIELQISYINDVANGKHTSYPMGKRKEMKPFYSKEIANNPQYGMSPFLPGYSFIYTGKIEQYVKIYATGARAGNSYISMIVSWFRKNGYDWVNEETTIAELTKIQKITTSFSSNSVIKSTAKLEI
jgi:hypothetical protein